MSDAKPVVVRGSCLCRSVRFAATLPTEFCGHCHCTMCQRSHGAAFVTWFGLKKEQLELTQGADKLVHHASSDHGVRSFCRECGSSLFCELSNHPGTIDIVLANMESPIDRAPQAHIYCSDRVSWIDVEDELPRLGGATGMEPLD